jgi:hypothetical protein
VRVIERICLRAVDTLLPGVITKLDGSRPNRRRLLHADDPACDNGAVGVVGELEGRLEGRLGTPGATKTVRHGILPSIQPTSRSGDGYLSQIVFSLFAGNRLLGLASVGENRLLSLGVGVVILAVIHAVPYLGLVVGLLVALFGLGAVVVWLLRRSDPNSAANVQPQPAE